jgi:hypothetical protein
MFWVFSGTFEWISDKPKIRFYSPEFSLFSGTKERILGDLLKNVFPLLPLWVCFSQETNHMGRKAQILS